MISTRCGAAATLALALSLIALAAAPAALGDMAPSGFGINAQILLWGMPRGTWNVHLSEMQGDGIRVVRTDAPWNQLEPSPPTGGRHHYSWSAADAVVQSLAEHGLRWLPVADYSSPWAASLIGDLRSPPANRRSYASYVGALVARFGLHGSYWRAHPAVPAMPITGVEIWNEENGPTFWHAPQDPARYASLYEDARAAAHKQDPNVEVIVGGLGAPAGDYLQEMYAALSRRGQIDAVGVHPYAPSLVTGIEELTPVRSVLDAHGDVNSPIEVTEFGWPTNGFPSTSVVPDNRRAVFLRTTADEFARADCGVERILPYTWTTYERSPSNPEDWFGIVHPNARPTASAAAYASEISQLKVTNNPDRASIRLCNRTIALRLKKAAPRPRRRRARHRHVACLRAVVTSAGVPLRGAVVVLLVTLPSGRARTVRLRTDAAGRAQACFKLAPRGHLFARATAERWDFASIASGYRSLQ